MIDREDLKHLASLARLAISPAEELKLAKDLESIVTYVSELTEAPVSASNSGVDIDKEADGYLARNVLRADNLTQSQFQAEAEREALVRSAPKSRNDFIVVKKIL